MKIAIFATLGISFSSAFVAPSNNNKRTVSLCETASPQGLSQNLGAEGPSGELAPPAPPPLDSPLWPVKKLFDPSKAIKVHGDTLRTCSLPEPINNIRMMLVSDGRPIISKFELWQGPDYTPWELEVYSEDGILRPVNALIATPKRENAIAVRNMAQMEFPFDACIDIDNSIGDLRQELVATGDVQTIQGGALRSYPIPEYVEAVQILLKTDGRHLKAKVELLQGPNNKKQVFDVYASDGSYRPLHIIVDTPGGGNMIRIVNKYTMEFPLLATVQPFVMNNRKDLGTDGLTLA